MKNFVHIDGTFIITFHIDGAKLSDQESLDVTNKLASEELILNMKDSTVINKLDHSIIICSFTFEESDTSIEFFPANDKFFKLENHAGDEIGFRTKKLNSPYEYEDYSISDFSDLIEESVLDTMIDVEEINEETYKSLTKKIN